MKEPVDSFIDKAWAKSEHSKDQSRFSKSPPKSIKDLKNVESRLFNATASVKGKYGSRYSSADEESEKKKGVEKESTPENRQKEK